MEKFIELYNNNKFGFCFIEINKSNRMFSSITFYHGIIIELGFFGMELSIGYVK